MDGMHRIDGTNGVNGTNGVHASTIDPAPYSPTRQELEAELAALKVRHADARSRLDTLDESLRAVLAAEVAASRERFAEMDRHFESMIAAVRDDAMREVDRIRSSAPHRTTMEVGGADE